MNEIHINKRVIKQSHAQAEVHTVQKSTPETKKTRWKSPKTERAIQTVDMENPQGTGADKSVSRELIAINSTAIL